jgi:hypothetical protein
VSLYHTTRGVRHTITYRDAPVAPNAWHTLRVDFKDFEMVEALFRIHGIVLGHLGKAVGR